MNATGFRIFIATCSLAGAGIAVAADTGDSFLTEAIQGNMGEVKVGALAQQKGASQGVKDFGAMLEKDHAAANRKAMSAAKATGADAPKQPGAEQKKVYDKLSKLSGPEFDRQFVKEMVEDHQKDIQKYTAEAAKGDGQASTYAQQTLPDLKKHLAMAERLQSAQGSAASSTTR